MRKDYLTEQHVCISPVRGMRPSAGRVRGDGLMPDEDGCPFCPGNSQMTPKETFSYGNARVVPNRYPALDPNEPAGFGFHEVIIDSPDHNYSISEAPVQSVTNTLMCIRERLRHFVGEGAVRAIQVFKNHGANAGASLYHPHWQLIAMPFIPRLKLTMQGNFRRYRLKTGRCYLCDTENIPRSNIVFETDGVVAFCPQAALYCYGVNIMTKSHAPTFAGLDEDVIAQMALAIQKVLAALFTVYERLSYNICFQCPPLGRDECEQWHFFMQIIPRSWHVAGFELGSACFINPVAPEDAAKRLRSAIYG